MAGTAQTHKTPQWGIVKSANQAQSQPRDLDYFFELMATVRVSFLLGGERFHGRLNRSSVLSDVPAKATRLNRAGPGYKVIRLRRLSHKEARTPRSRGRSVVV